MRWSIPRLPLLDPETWRRLRQAVATPCDPDDLEGFDRELVSRLAPVVGALVNAYFRLEVEGLEKIPPGAALLVGNHNAGISFLEVLGLGAAWYNSRGLHDPWYGLAHDTVMRLPGLGSFLHAVGGVRASPANGETLLRRGRKVIVFPGGNLEAFRPFSERHRIQFACRTGFVRLALEARVPIVPLVTIGGHEGFIVLHDGQRLARALRLDRWLRSETCPIFFGLPWGLGFGPIFHLPLPVKVRWQVLDPVSLDDYPPDAARRPELVAEVQQRVVDVMQAALDRLATERRGPLRG